MLKKNIEILINKDLESVGLSVFNLSSFYAKNNPKGYENKEFKDAIKEIKIGKAVIYTLLMNLER